MQTTLFNIFRNLFFIILLLFYCYFIVIFWIAFTNNSNANTALAKLQLLK